MTVVLQDEWLTIHHGDCRAVLAELEAGSVQTVVSSPPFFGLRDYGLPPSVWGGDPAHDHAWGSPIVRRETRGGEASTLEGTYNEAGRFDRRLGAWCACGSWLGCLGLEPDPALFVDHIVEVFAAVRRVLRPDGTVWLNLGDTYADRANRRTDGESFRADRADVVPGKRNTLGGQWALKAKDRMGIPHRVVFALQADGWWWRDEIVWHKPNPMPSSVEDRTTPAHEMVFLLTKRGRYHYDGSAIREARPEAEIQRELRGYRRVDSQQDHPGARPPGAAPHKGLHRASWPDGKVPAGWETEPGRHDRPHRTGRLPADLQVPTYTDARRPRGWDHGPDRGHDRGIGRYQPPEGYEKVVQPGRNKRSVWSIPTQPYPEAHFATFPETLIEPMVLAGSRPGDVVLDPFGGSGTTGMVANRLGRRAILIDLSEEYLAQAIKRIGASRAGGEGPAIDMPVPFANDGLWAEAEAVS